MKFRPIRDPIEGERTAEVLPRPAPLVDAPWARQRFVTGRAVSAEALRSEQDHHHGRLRLTGQALRPGVVSGLEVELEGTTIVVSAGAGVSASGDVVVLPRALRLDAGTLEVRPTVAVPATVPAADEEGNRTLAQVIAARKTPRTPPIVPTLPSVPSIRERLQPVVETSTLVGTLGRLGPITDIIGSRPRRVDLPLLMVLVLEPVVISDLANAGDPRTDPCDRDPASEPFEDWRYVDAVRAVWVPLYAWLDEDGVPTATFESTLPGAAHALRNTVATAIVLAEAARAEADAFPWARNGVALGLAGFSGSATPQWLDRWAVARRGGRRLHDDPIVPGAGVPALWRARMDQFADHLLALSPDAPLASQIRFLPAVGLLPRAMFDLENRTDSAFPTTWGLSAVPVPLDQLDAAIRPAMSLDGFDLSTKGDEVKVLVPVPSSSWDPGLLRMASVPVAFTRSVDEAERLRDDALLRRAEVRARLGALYGGLAGPTAVPVYAADPSGDAAVEDAASAWFWHNTAWMALLDSLPRAATPPPLLPAPGDVTNAVNAAVVDLQLQPIVATVLNQVAPTDPVVVVREPESATPSGASASTVVIGEGLLLPEMATDSVTGAAVLDAPLLVLVQGTVDTEVIDRAATRAAAAPLLLVGDAFSDAAREDLAWRRARHPERAVVALVLPRRFATAAQLHADLRVRLGLTSATATEWFRTLSIASVTATRCFLAAPAPAAATLAAYAQANFVGPLAVLPEGDPQRLPLLERQDQFGETRRGAWLRVPDRQGLAAQVRDAAERVQILRAVTGDTRPDEATLLALTGAREAAFGTVPTSEGLVAGALEELIDALQDKMTPETTLRVVRDDELATIGTLGVVGLLVLLEEKVKRADDAVDFGFLQVQAQVFRLRELMLGRKNAMRMASSPVLADISKLITGDSSPEQLASFFDDLKAAAATQPPPGTTPPKWRDTIYKRAGTYLELKPELTKELTDALVLGGKLQESLTFVAPPPEPTASGTSLKGTILGESAKTTTTTMLTDVRTRTKTTSFTSGGMLRLAAPAEAPVAMRASAPPPPPPSAPAGKAVRAGGPSPEDLGTKSRSVAQVVNAQIERKKVLQPPFTIRSAGLAKRVEKDDQATELRQAAFRLRAALTQTVANLDLNLQGVPFPGFLVGSPPVATALPLTAARVAEVLAGQHDVDSDLGTAPALFTDAIVSLETTAAILRVVEGRIREVREAIEAIKRTKLQIERSIGDAERREDEVGELLAQTRHDLEATRALLHEETERVDALNTRRARVRAEEIPFVVFRRAREVNLRDAVPVHDVEPTWSARAVLALFDRPAPPSPEELRDAVELFDDVPARWFLPVAALIPKLDTAALVHECLRVSVARAAAARALAVPQAPAWHAVYRARQQALVQARRATASIDIAAVSRLTWKQAQAQARATLTVGDLVTASARRPAVTREVTRFLDHVHTLLANLYTEVGLVAAHIRAEWVRLLSEFDQARDLRDLSDLPRWSEVGRGGVGEVADPFRRRELQGMVDWLFQQVDPKEPEAADLVNDLVRICILLASHAPVGRILAGLVEEDVAAEPGKLVSVRVDVTRARIGMTALFIRDGVVRARALVEDVGAERVTARVISGGAAARFGAGDTVHLVESDGLVHAGAGDTPGGVRMRSNLTFG